MTAENEGPEIQPGIPSPATESGSAPDSLFSTLLAELQTTEEPEPVPPPVETSKVLVRTAALESIMHVRRQVESMWGSPELDMYIFTLFIDSRDGVRKGLPLEVADELAFLAELNKTIRAIDVTVRLKVSLTEAYRLINEGDQSRLKMTQHAPVQEQSMAVFSSRYEPPAEGFFARHMPYLIIVGISVILFWVWSSGLIYAFLR